MTRQPFRITLVTIGVSGPHPEGLPWLWMLSDTDTGVDLRGSAPTEAEAWAECRREAALILGRLECGRAGRQALDEANQ